METNETIVQLTANNDTAHKVLNIMGYKVTRTETIWAEDDADDEHDSVDYEFNFSGSPDTIGYLGDDSIGSCVGLYNEENGTLVGIFNYGDEGDLEVDIDDSESFVRIADL